jgi:hypothetical protein
MFCTAVSIIFSRKDKMIKTPQAVPHITRMTRIGFSSGDENPSIQLFIILSSQMLPTNHQCSGWPIQALFWLEWASLPTNR